MYPGRSNSVKKCICAAWCAHFFFFFWFGFLTFLRNKPDKEFGQCFLFSSWHHNGFQLVHPFLEHFQLNIEYWYWTILQNPRLCLIPILLSSYLSTISGHSGMVKLRDRILLWKIIKVWLRLGDWSLWLWLWFTKKIKSCITNGPIWT